MAVPAAPPQQYPGQDGNVVPLGDRRPARGTRRAGRHDRHAIRHPVDDDVEERADGEAQERAQADEDSEHSDAVTGSTGSPWQTTLLILSAYDGYLSSCSFMCVVCHAHADVRISSRPSRPAQDLLRARGLGVERHGIPGTAGHRLVGNWWSPDGLGGPSTSKSDAPTPVPRFNTVVSPPPSRYSSALTCAHGELDVMNVAADRAPVRASGNPCRRSPAVRRALGRTAIKSSGPG